MYTNLLLYFSDSKDDDESGFSEDSGESGASGNSGDSGSSGDSGESGDSEDLGESGDGDGDDNAVEKRSKIEEVSGEFFDKWFASKYLASDIYK